jgi:8-oxo-dGTP pyrophosphatase MutT (NUDIX family)
VRRPGGRQVIPRPASWRPGGPAPWAGSVAASSRSLPLAHVVGAVREHRLAEPPGEFEGARWSAVLIALFEGGPAGAEVVLTRRSWHMRNHRGEISFPGGRLEPGETAVEAALRESEEEVGLDPAGVTVVGELDHLATVVSRSLIVPVVATLAGRPTLRPTSSEVERVLTVPLAELLRSDTYHEERWGTPPLDRPLHFFELDDETIWGATGRMLFQLLELATGTGDPLRSGH